MKWVKHHPPLPLVYINIYKSMDLRAGENTWKERLTILLYCRVAFCVLFFLIRR